MKRERIISKALIKLAMGGGDLSDRELQDFMKFIDTYVRRMRRDDLEAPKKFLKEFGDLRDRANYDKKDIQQILAKAKKEGLIKDSIRKNKHMEKAWRSILKVFGLRGFLLEN